MTSKNDIEKSLDDLLYGVQRSAIYHNKRVKFFDSVRKFISISVLLSGFGAITTLLLELGEHSVVVAAAMVALMSAIDLIFDPASHARLHNDLKRRFIQLERNIISSVENVENIKRFTSNRLNIESDEPPVLRVLDTICHNEWLKSNGYAHSHFKKISPFQRFIANFLDFRFHTIV